MTQAASIQTAFVAGELSPSFWGRVDHEKFKFGASTMRNGFVNFQGGYSSRPGSAYVGMCKQGAPNIGTSTINNTSNGTPVNTGAPRPVPFQFSVTQAYDLEFGDYYMRVIYQGAYVTETAVTVTSVSSAALFTTATSHGYSIGDWIYVAGTGSGLDGLTYVVLTVPTAETFTIQDLFGNTISSATSSTGGTTARIYTLTTIYQAVDLPFLKFTQSADEMSLTCWNQSTLTEYPPQDLLRTGNADWTLTPTSFTEPITAPTNAAATAQASTTLDTWYSYVVTAVDSTTGTESIASSVAYVHNNDISVNAGSNTITWSPVTGASSYNIYSAAAYYSTSSTVAPQIGVPFGYLGSALGTSFVDNNIVPDFTQVPPQHSDPFAQGAIQQVLITAGGSGFTQSSVTYSVTTANGTGFVGVPIILSGAVNGFYIIDPGEDYASGDTISFGGGSGATATLVIGPETGTYPGSVAYFQERRVYASTQNNPDTYFMSQPGAYANMDASIPSVDSDAIVGTPWAQQVNGIQFMTPMPGGLVIFTGGGAWQLNGGSAVAITPADQDAQPQTRYGCSSTVSPIPINFHILYVRENDGIVYDLVYNYWVQIYTASDLTIYSNHLFNGYTIKQWAYAEKPYKLVWAVRNDGTLLCLTYIAEQNEQGWTRHDTNGLYVGVCSIEEPPVDAVYVIVQRYINGTWVYYHERFDNRLWNTAEESFCVDAGLIYPMSYPNATLYPAASNGTSNITGTTIIEGGSGYTSPTASAVDSTGAGLGATFSVTVSGGVITAVTPTAGGSNYTPGYTQIIINDSTGAGAIINPQITNYVTFTASTSVFSSGMNGDVIRVGNGDATIVDYVSATQVVADITTPITAVVPNDPNNTPVPAVSGTWSISTPTSVVNGLNHLEGLSVTGLADGGVISPSVVENGQITLPVAASAITVGLPFAAQLQTLYLEIPSPNETIQTKRKTIPSVGIRVHDTRGVTIGTNQIDASTQPGNANVTWTNMVQVKERNQNIWMGQALPLYTGDYFQNIPSDWQTGGQVAVQSTLPLPLNVDAIVSYVDTGDQPG